MAIDTICFQKEQDRMDLVYHAILRMFDGKPFFAPIENPQRIVDMGTGTGQLRVISHGGE